MTSSEIFMPTEIVFRSVEELLPYARNSRKHSDAQVAALAGVIKTSGWTNPCLIADGTLLAGHGRILAARKLGLVRVPCIDLSHLSDDERRALVISDNRLAEMASWDLGMLKLETDYLRDAGLDVEAMTGFGEEDLAALLEGVLDEESGSAGNGDPEDIPPVPEDPVSRMGDIWVCGDHRIGCMDSLSLSAWDTLMDGDQADLCVTDPPYNVGYESKLAGKIKNDDMGDTEFRKFLLGAYSAMFAVMKPGAPIYVAHSDTEGLNFRSTFREAGFKLSGCLIWRKQSLVLGRSDYQWMHEPVLYGWKPGAAHKWYGGRKLTTVLAYGEGSPFRQLEDGRWAVVVGDSMLVVSGDATVEEVPGSVIFHEKPARSEIHPTVKPTGLWRKFIEPSSRPGDVVIDPFSGSGTTMITCEMTGRKARVSELDAKFVDVAVRRWEHLTGRRAVHAVTGEYFPAENEQRIEVSPVIPLSNQNKHEDVF